jgi:hypothetical protein
VVKMVEGSVNSAKAHRRRASICALGFDSSGASTPARVQVARGIAAAISATPIATPRTAKSPFYGGKAVLGDGSGCVDPRPTALLLLDALLHRVSDRSPAVRARALTAISALLQPTHAYAVTNAALLGHLAAAVAYRVARACAGREGGTASGNDSTAGADVSLPFVADVTMAWLGDNSGVDATMADVSSSRSAGLRTPLPAAVSAGADAAASVHLLSTPGPHPLVPILVRRLQDTKPGVRKASLAVVEALAKSGSCELITSRALFGASVDTSSKPRGAVREGSRRSSCASLAVEAEVADDTTVERCAKRVLAIALQVRYLCRSF